MNDLLFNAVQAVAFGVVFLAGLHSVFAVVAASGFGSGDCRSLWSPAILGEPLASRGIDLSLVSLAERRHRV